eukprot:1162376-Prorocentrum_lima.AAC.1
MKRQVKSKRRQEIARLARVNTHKPPTRRHQLIQDVIQQTLGPTFDLGHSLQPLRSQNNAVVRETLRVFRAR